MRRATIEDISRLTGLSHGTVSRALNDRPDISDRTKRRVLDACTKLKYVRSHAARCLATGRNLAVAVLIDDLHSPLSACVLRGLAGSLQAVQYTVQFVELSSDPDVARQRIRSVCADRLDALLVSAPLSGELAALLKSTVGDKPIATCRPLDGFEADQIGPDGPAAGRLAGKLLARGGGALLYIDRAETPGAAARREAFSAACGAARAGTKVYMLAAKDPDSLSELRDLMQTVSGIAAADDHLALRAMQMCLEAGRRPGRDVAVVGYGNESFGASLAPTLTSVDPCGCEIGQRIATMLLQRIDSQRMDSPQSVAIAPTLIARQSTAHLKHA